ncbi:MAG: inositol monophosphatase family protein [Gemmatimonadales bacterium]
MGETRALLELARTAAEAAVRYIRDARHPDERGGWTSKGQSDFVTDVDLSSESLIAEVLSAGEPGSLILGEELTPEAGEADLVWIVDPLDGTTNYLHGFPEYAVSIAALAHGTPVAAVVRHIVRDEVYTATAGGGAYRNDVRLTVSDIVDPALALVGTGFPFKVVDALPQYLHQFQTILTSTSGIRRAGAAALDLATVAAGILDGFWELYLAPWDVAAGVLLIREAGGAVTDIAGDSNVIKHGTVVGGNPRIHAWLIETLSRS